MALSKEFHELMDRCRPTIAYLESAGVADAYLIAGALHHSRPAEKMRSLAQPPMSVAIDIPVVRKLFEARLSLERSMPFRTKAERDALVARAIELAKASD